MKLRAKIDPAAAIAAGSNLSGEIIADIDVSALSDAQRTTLGRMVDVTSADAIPRLPRYPHGILDVAHLVAWLHSLAAEEAALAAEQAARQEAKKAELRAAWGAGKCPWVHDDIREWAAQQPEYRAAQEKQAAEQAAKNADDDAARLRWQIAAAEEERERLAWILARGSETLRRSVAEGIEHCGRYRNERLALERPGWEWDEYAERDIANPPKSAFALLDAARAIDPSAKLTRIEIEHPCECTDTYCSCDTEPTYEWAARAKFLGRDIIYRA